MSLIIPLILAILMIPLVIGILRINELFMLRVRDGKVRKVRGRIPKALLSDISDIARELNVPAAEVRAVVEDGRASIYVHGKGIPRAMRQRLRNTVAMYPLAKIRSAPK